VFRRKDWSLISVRGVDVERMPGLDSAGAIFGLQQSL